jgi:hypothetical protein
MAQIHLSDEILMAFADGELDEPVAAAVEKAMAGDPAIAKRVAEFLRSRRLARSAFPEETAADVSPELRAAVQARIDRFEPPSRQGARPGLLTRISMPFAGRRPFWLALAASVAGLVLVTAAYVAGPHYSPTAEAAGPIALLADPQLGRVLSESRSGQEQDLPFGRIRVVSTFRVTNGSLCREFKFLASSGTADAVACRNDGWKITFAVAASMAGGAYVPSGEGDLMESYLQSVGAGEPLLDAAEIAALREPER